MTAPSQTGPSNTFIYPSVDAAGDLYVAFASFPINPNRGPVTLYVAKSTDDGVSFSPFVAAATVGTLPTADLPNTTFRDGITESFAASPTHKGHLYLTYEDWDGTQMDVKFTQSTDGGLHLVQASEGQRQRRRPGKPTDQFQPSIAAGPDGAVAVAFYDRRTACPSNDPSVLPEDVGRTNFCIDTTLQAYKDTGSGASAGGGQLPHLRIHLGSDEPRPACRRDRADGLCERYRPLHDEGLHRRLLRPGHLEDSGLRAVCIDALPIERDRRRGRPGLLPATSTLDG